MTSTPRYILHRIIGIIPVIFMVLTINFVIIHLVPGDVALLLAGEGASPEQVEAVREAYGLNKPLHEQFFTYFNNLIHGDLGVSYVRGRPVIDMILERIPATLILLLTGLFFSAITGTIIGALSAKKMFSKTDTLLSTFAVSSYSMPSFWIGLILIYFFALHLGWFPTSGISTVGTKLSGLAGVFDFLRHLFLPALSISFYFIGQYIRLARASVGEVMTEDYINTCRAIGYKENTIFIRHALRNALLPIITLTGLQVGLAVAGATLTETVFAWPGIGRLIYSAIASRDLPVVMGCFVFIGIGVTISTLIVDIVYTLLDPRVQHA